MALQVALSPAIRLSRAPVLFFFATALFRLLFESLLQEGQDDGLLERQFGQRTDDLILHPLTQCVPQRSIERWGKQNAGGKEPGSGIIG